MLTAELAESYRDTAGQPRVSLMGYLGSIYPGWASPKSGATDERMRFWLRALGALAIRVHTGLFPTIDALRPLIAQIAARVPFPESEEVEWVRAGGYWHDGFVGQLDMGRGPRSNKMLRREQEGWQLLQSLTEESSAANIASSD